MGLFNSEVGNHSWEYTQGNLGQNGRDSPHSYAPCGPVNSGQIRELAQMKTCGICARHSCEEEFAIYRKVNGTGDPVS